jgi:serine-type D-Ala-D-Ala carboxypeptidase (penicillin-binding protein 5/6)
VIRRWLPLLCAIALLAGAQGASGSTAFPVPEAVSFIVVNPDTGEMLAAADPDQPLAMASITKVMTALVVIENAGLDDRYTVPPEAILGGSSGGLEAGEELSVRHLLTALMVSSGNDASVTLAKGLSGSEEAFVELMNDKARELGLDQTSFRNPHGLDEPGHFSTVREIVELSQVAMRDRLFRELVASRRATIPGPGGVGERVFESNNLLLDAFPEADGIKTGMTSQAGYTLAAHARRPSLGVQLYVVLIGASSSEGRARDAEALLRWGFSQYARPTLVAPGTVVGRVPVQYRPGASVPYRVERAVRPPIRLGEPLTEEIVAPREIDGPVDAGDILGSLTIRQGDRVVARRDLVAAESSAAPGIVDRINAGMRALIP